MTRIIGGQALLPSLHEQYYARNEQTAYKREEQEHPGHREHPDNEIEADVRSRVRRLAYLDDDRVLLQKTP